MKCELVSSRKRLMILGLSTILCSGLAAPVAAQTSPTYRNLDQNGVDLTHGDYQMGLVEGSIGSGDSELTLVRDGPWYSGFNGHRWDAIVLTEGLTVRTVSFGQRMESFNGSISQQANGSTLTGNFTHRSADGTTTEFMPRNPDCNPVTTGVCVWVPTSIATPDGKAVSLEYESWLICPDIIDVNNPCRTDSVRLTRVKNSAGYSVVFDYGGGGSSGMSGAPVDWFRRIGADFYNEKVSSSPQAHVSYAYPSVTVTDVTDTAGRAWRISGSGPTVSAIRRPGATGDTTTISRSGVQVTSLTRDGITTSYNRTLSGTTATMVVTNALSQVLTVVSDMTVGRPTSVTNALGQTTGYQYDSYGRRTQITSPEGNKTVLVYDARGNVTSTTLQAKPGLGLADIVTTASYPATCSNAVTCNSPEWTRDAKGNQTDYAYDPTHGGLLTVTAPADATGARPQTRYSYTLTGGVYLLTGTSQCVASGSCAGTAAEIRTAATYNSNFLPASVTREAGDGSISSTTAMTYSASGDVKTVDGSLSGAGDTTTYRYDAGRRLTGVVGPDPDGGGVRKPTAQRMTYGNDGLTLKEVGIVADAGDTAWAGFSSQQQVAVSYDTNARPVKTELKAGGTTYAVAQTSYDALGRIDCSVQRMNPAAFGSLPASACAAGTAGSDGPDRIAKTSYDNAGRTVKVQTAYGVSGVQADEVTAAYSNNGQVATATDAEGNKTTYEYDGFDRLAKTIYPSTTKGAGTSNASDYEQLGYDANSNVTSRRLRDGTTIGYTYDNAGRLRTKDLPGSEPDVVYAPDLLGRPSWVSQGGQSIGIWIDALDRITATSGPHGTVSSSYDTAGRRTSMVYPGGTLTVNYDYDVAGSVTAIRENGATSGIGVLAAYAYDDLGRQTSVTFGNGSVQSFGYDAVSRLSTLTNNLGGSATTHDLVQAFGYNPASQIASVTRGNDAYAWQAHYNVDRSYVADGLNRIMNAGSTVFSYDARGNLTSDGTNSFTYSAENLLKTGPGSATLGYDPLGRLYETAKAGVTTRLQFDGADLIGEYDGSNAIQRRYVHGPGTDNPIVWYEGSGMSDRRFLMADERGSIVSVTDSAGSTIHINAYDEYGIPAPGNVGRFGYTGQTWLPEVGMWYYKARIYSPTLGRFMQTDPVGYADGMNWYSYVKSDPINSTDPFGLEAYDGPPIDVIGKKYQMDEPNLPSLGSSGMSLSFSSGGSSGVGGGGSGSTSSSATSEKGEKAGVDDESICTGAVVAAVATIAPELYHVLRNPIGEVVGETLRTSRSDKGVFIFLGIWAGAILLDVNTNKSLSRTIRVCPKK